MRRILLVMLLCMGMKTSHAQQFFNVRDPLHSFFSMITTVVPFNKKYYCAGFSWDSSNYIGNGMATGIEGIFLAVFDPNGNKLFDTNYQKVDRDITPGFSKMLLLPDSNLLLTADQVDTFGNRYLAVMKFDTNGHLLFEKEFVKPFCVGIKSDFIRIADLKADNSGNYLLLSRISCQPSSSAFNHEIVLTKLDSDFDVIWHKQFGHAYMDDAAWKLVIESDGYLLAGGRNNTNLLQKNFSLRALLMKTDTAGNVLWEWLSDPFKKTFEAKDVIRTKDGGYVYCGSGDGFEIVSANGQSAQPAFRGWVEKLDSNRNVVWSKSFNNYYGTTEFKKIIEAPDGRLLLFGDKYMPDSLAPHVWDIHTSGWFLTLNANGDSLRERIYYHVRTCDDKNIFYDVAQTDDGGFIMVGEATDRCAGFTAPTQRGWLVKVDSNGCLGPGDPQCWPTAVTNVPYKSATKLYPNPVQETLTISYANKTDKGANLQVTDVTGRKVLELILEGQSGRKLLNVKELQAGVYLYRIMEDKAVTLQGKFVKQ